MKTPKALQKACRVLRSRVRYDRASIALPGSIGRKDDTPVIRAATRVYVESWIVPLLDAIERGELDRLETLLLNDRGHEIGRAPDTIYLDGIVRTDQVATTIREEAFIAVSRELPGIPAEEINALLDRAHR